MRCKFSGDWWHLVKEKGSSFLWLDNKFTPLTNSVAAALLLILVEAASAGDLAGGRPIGVICNEHGCTLGLNRHCVQVNVHLERYPQLLKSQN